MRPLPPFFLSGDEDYGTENRNDEDVLDAFHVARRQA